MADYRHKIVFLESRGGSDKFGEPKDNWKEVTSVWASVSPLLGNELFSALTTDTKVEVKFNCRYIPGITNDMRIQYNGKKYEILSAINVKELNRELLCYCRLVK